MASDAPLLPEVLDNSGKPIVGPDLDAVLKRVTEMATLANLAKIRRILEDKVSHGRVDTFPVTVTTDRPMKGYELFYPAQTASITNDGPNRVLIGFNYNDNPYNLAVNEVLSVDFEEHVLRRVYWQAIGGSTNVRLVVKG